MAHLSATSRHLDRRILENRDSGRSIDDPLWHGLDRVLASAPSDAALNTHGLGPLAAWRKQVHGEPVPDGLTDISRRSAYGTVTVNPLLERIRAAIDGPIVLIKGPEVASLYPLPRLRPFGDLDLVVADLQRAETQLLAAGFELVGPADHIVPGHHHDRPMRLPGMALAIELHRNPGWLNWQRHPRNDEVFARAVPSVTGVEGILAMPPTDRALLLAAHSWRHGPYYSYVHLVDLALARREVDSEELGHLARRWGLEGAWDRLNRAIDSIYYGDPIGRAVSIESGADICSRCGSKRWWSITRVSG